MHSWEFKGFEALSKGTYGNAGQNLYVSKNGVLQRIWQFDVNKDGYVDLLIANSHAYNEHPDVHIISDPCGEAHIQKVLTQDGQAGQVADINGNGYDDLIVATANDGHHMDVSSYVYFGGKDGITENRKIDLAAKGCTCCGVGDVNGDGKKEILYLVESGSIQQNFRTGRDLRVYAYEDYGFQMDGYRDYRVDISWFEVADLDGDGCDDLYCRTDSGKWLILWGGKDGFFMENATQVGVPTDDYQRFDVQAFGGGNVRYAEFARSKIVTLEGRKHLFYADAEKVTFYRMEGRTPVAARTLEIPNVISVAAGHIAGDGRDDLVVLQVCGNDQRALVYLGDWETPVRTMPVMTPRDALLCDFTGTGHDDIVIVQGRGPLAFTSESLVYPCGPDGIGEEPKRFVTHNCVEAHVGDFTGCGKKSLVFINQQESFSYGHVPVYIFLNSENGFDPNRRIEFSGHSAGTLLSVDINDDGWPDILLLQNAEDQPFLKPPADLYWGGPNGFDPANKAEITAPLAWGGHCADINKDGYLDIIACCTDHIRIIYGGPEGYKDENTVIIDPMEDMAESAMEGRVGVLFPAMADLNGDGWLDLVVPMSWNDCSLIYWGGPEGYSNERRTKIPVELGLTVRIADLNKDGYPDLIFGSRTSFTRNVEHEGPVTILWGGPDGYSGYNCCVLPAYESDGITIADFNGDGWLDIFAASYFNSKERDINSYIYWNDHGNFSVTNRKRMFCHSSAAAWACDFNEDGYMDICVSHHRAYGNHNTESAIWWNGPEGFKEENRTWLPAMGPHDMTPNDQGDIMNRGPEETYITTVGIAEQLRYVGWVGEIPQKTWVNCQIRTAETEQALEGAPFIGCDGTENSRFTCNQPIDPELVRGKYFQIKLFLGAVNSGSTPRITEIYAD